jgi:hypothetical protein
MILLVVVGIAVGSVVVVVALIAGLGAISDRLRGVNGAVAALKRRGVPSQLVDTIQLELQSAGGGLGFALICFVFGIPVLGYGVYFVRSYMELYEQALYVAPGIAMLLLAAFLLARGRAKLSDSVTYTAVVGRAAEVVELVPTAIYQWVITPNALVNAMGYREKTWMPLAQVILRYRSGEEHVLRAFQDDDATSTVLALRPLMPSAVVAPYRAPVQVAPTAR